ncbi:MAG: hypothetical protein Q8J89_12925 [Caulobacter sp.]|nr:hypothetical protein [Caulobacter sp.]
MTGATDGRGWRGQAWRMALWGGLIALLLLPLAAMQVTAEVAWDSRDFAIFGVMLAIVGGAIEAGVRLSGSPAYRLAVAIAAVAGFLLVWANLAVGVIGNEDNPLNAMFGGILLVGVLGAAIARFRASGMARTMIAMAAAQVVVAVVAQIYGHFIWPMTVVFAAIWLGSAALFRKAARTTP